MTDVAVLDRLTLVTLLGVRFFDAATGAVVSVGMSASVYPKGAPERVTLGLPSRSGVFVFRNLPGLRALEHGRGDEAFWLAEPPRYPFVLEVQDAESRFLPFRLDILLPVRRPLGLPIASPLSPLLAPQFARSADALPLFSSPSRPLPDAMGVLRAELVDATTGQPAAWAVVEARGPGQRASAGMADASGRVMLPLPYPKPVITLGSPGSPRLPLTAQTWTIALTVRYLRRSPSPVMPDLAEVLSQPAATAWQNAARTTALTDVTLRFGRDLVLSSLTAGGTASSSLLITSAGSPL